MSIIDNIPERDLPVKKPSGAARVRYVDGDGKSYSSAMPDVIAASALLHDAIDGVVADAEAEISVIVNGMGYLPPVAFASGLNVDSSRFTVTYGGVTYAPVADAIPFTTTGTFNPAQWRVVQGVTAADLSSSSGAGLVGFQQLGTGATPRTIASKLRERISVLDFGAVGVSGVDDRAAIQQAVTYAATRPGATLVFPATPYGYYDISGKVSIPPGVSVYMEQPVKYTGTGDEPILEIGAQGVGNTATSLRVGATRATIDWTKTNTSAVKLINLQYGRADVFAAENCNVGVYATGWDAGFAYSEVALGRIRNNKHAVIAESRGSGGPGGYINENIWINGNYVVDSMINTSDSRYGFVLRSADGFYTNNNNNVLFKPCFQLWKPSGSAECICFVVNDGSMNHVVKARCEANKTIARWGTNAASNVFEIGYINTIFDEVVENASLWGNNFLRGGYESMSVEQFDRQVCSFSDLGRKARGVSGVGIMVEGLSFGMSASSARTAVSGSAVTFDDDGVTLVGSRGIGVFVDTTAAKQFMVKRAGSAPGRVGVVCYDGTGTILTGAGRVFAVQGMSLNAQSSFGGCYQTSTDTFRDVVFRVSDDVKRVWVFIAGGSADAKISQLSIFTTLRTTNVAASAGFQTGALEVSETYDFPSIAAGASATLTVAVPGASLGDFVQASLGVSLGGLSLTAYVHGANSVVVVLANNTPSAVDLGSSAIRIRVTKQRTP